ncbi:MAG: hypothetical protein EA344_11730 [Alkalicoccus sp.]|nr:MAG: hypothetical protein EA344_11730 [Alkalicoccus sp.]
MKRGLFLLPGIFTLAACGQSPEEELEELGKEIIELQAEQAAANAPPEVDAADVTVSEEIYYQWTDGESPTVNYYAKIQNDTPEVINLYGSSLSWIDEKGDLTLITDGYGISVTPEYIMPGEEGYISVWEPRLSDEEIEGAELSLSVSGDTVKINTLEVSDVNIKEGVNTLGWVTNNSDNVVEDITVIGAYYDEEDNFLGTNSTFLEGSLEPEQEKGFELTDQYVPKVISRDRRTVKVHAYVQ